MKSSEVIGLLRSKLRILTEIKINTQKQGRFASRGEMRGLRRLLNEREALIWELLSLDREMTADCSRLEHPELKKLVGAISAIQLEILDCWGKTRQEALSARDRAGAQLFAVRNGRRLQHQYVNRWATPTQGARINRRG